MHYSSVIMAIVAAIATVGAAPTAAQQPAHQHPPQRPAAHAQRPLTSEATRVAATLDALFAAAEGGDLTALDTLYAGDSLTVIEGAGMDRTWAEYRDHHLVPELKEMKNFHYQPSDIEARVVGNMAWSIFRYTLKADVGSSQVDIVGRGTAVLERRGQRWVVRHIHTSGRPRRPNDPPAGR